MSADLYINMSNEQIPIYQNFEWNNPGPQIGKLYPREAFCAEYGEGFTIASFRIHDKKGGEDKGRRARRRTQAG